MQACVQTPRSHVPFSHTTEQFGDTGLANSYWSPLRIED
jgi:hypothetical protein